MRSRFRAPLLSQLLVFCSCFLAGWLEQSLVIRQPDITIIGMMTGTTLLLLLEGGWNRAPAAWAGLFLSLLSQGQPLSSCFLLSTGSLLTGGVALYLLRRAQFHRSLARARHTVSFLLLGVVASSALSVLFRMIAWYFEHGEIQEPGRLALITWISECVGALVVAPFLLTCFQEPWRSLFRPLWLERAVWLLVLFLVGCWIFCGWASPHLPLAFLPFPVLVWGAIRYGGSAASFGGLVITILSSLALLSHQGPFGQLSITASLLVQGLFLIVLFATGLCIAAVVAEHRASDHALRESRELFRAISEQMPDGLFLLSTGDRHRAGTVLHANNAAARMRNCTVEELIGRSIFDLVLSDRQDAVPSRLEHLLEGKTLRSESVHRRLDGTAFPVDISSRLILYGGRRVILLLVRDITSRREAEEQLRQSQERLEEAQEIAKLGSWEWYPAEDRLIYSAEMYRLMGLSPETFSGSLTEAMQAIHPEDREMIGESVRHFLETGIPGEGEYRVQDSDGNVRHLTTPGLHVERDAEGNIYRVIGTALDVTERKREEARRKDLEERILQGQKLESLGVLAGGIAHDFNNLLTVILGNASLALMELPSESSARESIHRIETASQRAADLCNQMLAYSGKGHFQITSVSLNLVIDEMTHLLETVISRKAVLRFNLADPLPAVEADVTQLRQIILNLITNASDALGEKSGVISLTTGVMQVDNTYLEQTLLSENLQEGLYVHFEVSDTGGGMGPETLSRIFDPFFTTKFTGRGLGLAAVLGIVRGHRGAIKVYSQVGRGTTFKILLPASEAAETELMEETTLQMEFQGSGAILIVEDEEGVRALAKATLERVGFEVLVAEDGREGIETFREHQEKISLVLLDMMMPRMTGEEAFREMRLIRPDVRVLLTSGYNEQEATNRFTGKGLAGFIQKPYRPAELIEKIHEIQQKEQRSSEPVDPPPND